MILMVAPGPHIQYGPQPSGSVYTSDAQSLIFLANNSTADQIALQALGCATLVAFGAIGSYGFGALADLYGYDTAQHLPKYSVAQVFADGTSGNNGTWYKSGTGNGTGNWTQGSPLTITQLTTNLAAEATARTAADTTLTTAVSAALAPPVALTGGNVDAATTAALPSSTYNNGTAGVGATFTASANGAFPAQDGVTLSAGKRLLVKNASGNSRNGIYAVTQIGDAGTPWILTRATDADTPAELGGALVTVTGGTTLAGKRFLCPTAPGAISIGSTAIVFLPLG